ncbi:MAG: alkaline phosphatase family protein [Sulfuricella sp.]
MSTTATRTIVFVWDGLRPDSVNATDTPNLYSMRQKGVWFADNHSTYPTFTMMNGSSFATGSFPATTGFYGNTFWTPPQGAAGAIPSGKGAGGTAADYVDPVFTEDWSILTTLDAYYGNQLLLVQTLFQAAQAKGLVTAAVGKSGAAFIQDMKKGGYILDENTVFPQSLVTELQTANIALPANVVNAYPAGTVTLAANNGNPTAQISTVQFSLPNGVKASDASDNGGAKATAANQYMMNAYLNYILPKKKPDLSLIWFRDPDSTEHAYGPGSNNYKAALKAQDTRLGELLSTLQTLGMDKTTNVIVVSDHAHNNVSGPTALFPLRAISGGALGAVDTVNGFSTSGDVRSAELLSNAGFTRVYDGSGCLKSGMAGIKADGTSILPVLTDTDGSVCGTANTTYQTKSYKVPATLPTGTAGNQPIVIAANGGSDYFYVPSHDTATVQKLVTFLQDRQEYGAIFVDSRYGNLPGALSLSTIKLENATRKGNGQPDVVVSFSYDEKQLVNGLPGIEYESFGGNRGMHGSFSPIDVHNTLIAYGPSFQAGVTVTNPSGNVDVAPTVAYLLGTSLLQADGRVLYESLVSSLNQINVTPTVVAVSVPNTSSSTSGLVFQSPLDPTGATTDNSLTGTYTVNLVVKNLSQSGKTYTYFDSAKVTRQ